MKTKQTTDREEALGEIWRLRERRQATPGFVKEKLVPCVPAATFDDLLANGFIAVEGNEVRFTAAGETVARDITRRHRLAERLLVDVLEVSREIFDESAHEFEHIISEDVADAICTLLGHPRVCPHGSPIPEGPCCRRAETNVEPIVLPLSGMEVGDAGKIAYVVTGDHPHLHKLMSFGIVPGTEIRLHQKAPSYVITVGETQIALDASVASQIFVRRT